MTIGTIYIGSHEDSCEVVVMPETTQVIQGAKEAIMAAGFRIENDAPCVGNFAVRFSEEHNLEDLQQIINGDIVGSVN